MSKNLLPLSITVVMMMSATAVNAQNLSTSPAQKPMRTESARTSTIDSKTPVAPQVKAENEDEKRLARYKELTLSELEAKLARYELKLEANSDKAEVEIADLRKEILLLKKAISEKSKQN